MPPPSSLAAATSGSGPLPQSLAKFGCARCRQHHLKCDRLTPTCTRCLNAGEPCRPPSLKIREINKHRYKFTKKQKWVKTPRRLVFIDESQATIHDAESAESAESGPEESETATGSATVISEVSSGNTPPIILSTKIPPLRPTSPRDRLRQMMISSVVDPPTKPPPLKNPNAPSWPLKNAEEAQLFRHFVEKLALWLDLCDPRRTFETAVPQVARDSPVLLQAIFGLAARHLGQTGSDDGLKKRYNQLADTYNEACINIMKDHLLSKDYHHPWTEHLFASTIILQVMEEMNAGLRDDDFDNEGDASRDAVRRGHLPGMYRFVRDNSFKPGTLGAASFWVGLRQEIYSAVTKRQPVCLNLAHPSLVDRSFHEADDYNWANMAVVHCADVVNFCFGSEEQEQKTWEELDEWNRLWLEKQPPSYDPIFKEPLGSAVFPEIWYHRSCHVISIQHHRLAKLFLLDHRLKPSSPVMAGERETVRDNIRTIMREICGIGLGNKFTPPGIFTACMAISAFGHYFDKVNEQDAMLAILEQTQRDHARPTESVRREMLRAWNRHLTVVSTQSLNRIPHTSHGSDWGQ